MLQHSRQENAFRDVTCSNAGRLQISNAVSRTDVVAYAGCLHAVGTEGRHDVCWGEVRCCVAVRCCVCMRRRSSADEDRRWLFDRNIDGQTLLSHQVL